MKEKCRRFLWILLSISLITVNLAFPSLAATAPALSLTPESYVISLMFDAMGIGVKTTPSSLQSWIGEWDSFEEYQTLGKQGELGAYDQWVYDLGKGHEEDKAKAREDFDRCFGWLMGAKTASWGDEIVLADGVLSSGYNSLKTWLSTFPSYGTDSTDYQKPLYLKYPYISASDSIAVNAFSLDFTDAPDPVYIFPLYKGKANGICYYMISTSYPHGTYYDTYYNKSTDILAYNRYFYSGSVKRVYYYSSMYLSDRMKTSSSVFGISIDNMLASTASPPYEIFLDYAEKLFPVDNVLPVESVSPELQKVTAGALEGITLPANEEEAKGKLQGIDLGSNLDSIISALKAAGLAWNPGIDVPGESESASESETSAEGTDDKTVVGKLSSLITAVEAIPSKIADFFSIDTEAINAAFRELLAAFQSKFEVFGKLSNIFKESGRSFSETPPVFTMGRPDFLEFAYPENEIVVMDLRPYAEYFWWGRTLLSAMIWLAFGNWLMNQFDVKFHIG